MSRTGRPPIDLDTPVGTRDVDGAQVNITIQQRIVEHLRVGAYFEEACAAAGVSKVAAYNWQREGARLERDVLSGQLRRSKLTKRQRQLIDFVNAVDEATHTWAVQSHLQLERLARGGMPTEVVTEKYATDPANPTGPGILIESTTRTSALVPNAAVLMWRLERRFPDRWGRQRVEVTGVDGGPLEVVSPRETIVAQLGIIEARLTGEPVPELSRVSADASDVFDASLEDFDQ